MRDLQAVASSRPTTFDFDLTTPTLTRTGNDRFHAGTGLELGGRYSLTRTGDQAGLVVGLAATTESYSYDAQDFMFTYGLRGSLGIGWAVSDHWTLTGEGGLLYGRTSLSLPASSIAPEFSADGPYRGYDARVACLYAVTRSLLVSLQAGYLQVSHDLATGPGDQLVLRQKGVYVGIGLSWRFSNAPVHVE